MGAEAPLVETEGGLVDGRRRGRLARAVRLANVCNGSKAAASRLTASVGYSTVGTDARFAVHVCRTMRSLVAKISEFVVNCAARATVGRSCALTLLLGPTIEILLIRLPHSAARTEWITDAEKFQTAPICSASGTPDRDAG